MGPRAGRESPAREAPSSLLAPGRWFLPSHVHLLAPWPSSISQGLAAPRPAHGPLPWQHPFVRRPRLLPSLLSVSFFNSSLHRWSHKLPLSPWGRRGPALFPSQTSVSINTWCGLPGRAWEARALSVWRGWSSSPGLAPEPESAALEQGALGSRPTALTAPLRPHVQSERPACQGLAVSGRLGCLRQVP